MVRDERVSRAGEGRLITLIDELVRRELDALERELVEMNPSSLDRWEATTAGELPGLEDDEHGERCDDNPEAPYRGHHPRR